MTVNKSLINALVLLLMMLNTRLIFSQTKVEKKVKIGESEYTSGFEFFNLGNNGLIVYSTDYSKKTSLLTINISKFDAELTHEKSIKFVVPQDFYIFSISSNNNDLIISCGKDGQLIKYLINTANLSISEPAVSKIPEEVSYDMENYFGDQLYFTAKIFYPNRINTFDNYNLLYRVDFKSGEYYKIPIEIPDYSDKETDIIAIQHLPNEKEVWVFFKKALEGGSESVKNSYDSFLLRLDENGEKIALENLTEKDDHVLLKFTAFEMTPNETIIMGSYALIPNEESEGMYFGKIKNGEIDFIKYHDYTKSLDNYFSSYSEDAQEFMAKKIEKVEKNGKKYLRDDYFVAHPLIQHANGYYFIGEIYWKNVWEDASPYWNTGHAIIISFDENGNILWNNSMGVDVSDFDYYEEKETDVSVEFENEMIKLKVANMDSASIMLLNTDGTIESLKTFEHIKIKKEGSLSYKFWNDNRFISGKYLWGDRSYDYFLIVTTYPD